MNIKIESNFRFSVVSIQYSATGELSISLSSDVFPNSTRYQYSASLGSGQAEEKPTISLLEYTKSYAASANIKPQTKDTYRLMCRLSPRLYPVSPVSGLDDRHRTVVFPKTGLCPPRCL